MQRGHIITMKISLWMLELIRFSARIISLLLTTSLPRKPQVVIHPLRRHVLTFSGRHCKQITFNTVTNILLALESQTPFSWFPPSNQQVENFRRQHGLRRGKTALDTISVNSGFLTTLLYKSPGQMKDYIHIKCYFKEKLLKKVFTVSFLKRHLSLFSRNIKD